MGKATATLTDVKNKTGNVFALAKKHGSVIITSYNKPRFILSTYEPEEEPSAITAKKHPVELAQTQKEPISSVLSHPAKPKIEKPVETAVPFTPNADKPKAEPPVAIAPIATVKPEINKIVFGEDSESKEHPLQQEQKPDHKNFLEAIADKVDDIIHLEGLGGKSWDRKSKIELEWVKTARQLFS